MRSGIAFTDPEPESDDEVEIKSIGQILANQLEGLPSSEEVVEDLEKKGLSSIVEWQTYKDNQMIGNLDSTVIDCKTCLNRGYYYTSRNNTGDLLHTPARVICKCLKVRESAENARNSGLGNLMDHRAAHFQATDDWQKELKQLVTDYVSDANKEWIAVLGQSGAGKTMLCSAISNKRLADGHEVRYLLWRDYVSNLKQSQFNDRREENNRNHYFEHYANAEILYIDDLFKGTVTDTDKSYAFELINHRYNKSLVTIISSELLLLELAELDQAVAGRLKEKAGKYCFQISKDIKKNFRFKEGRAI